MPISALPEHLNSKEEIEANFPDDSQYGDKWYGKIYRWYNKTTKTWFAFSSRCPEWWARWRKVPKVLFAMRGEGLWRAEYPLGGANIAGGPNSICNVQLPAEQYLSRIQYYCRWHISIQWPLIVTFHFYPHAKDVPVYRQPMPDTDGKLWFFYWNHYDNDLVYWMITSIYLGRNWK